MTAPPEPTVAGVSALALYAILQKTKMGPEKDGLVRFSLKLDREENALFTRALAHVETDLRVDERLGLAPEHKGRTATQRRYDALELLIFDVARAVEEYTNSAGQS